MSGEIQRYSIRVDGRTVLASPKSDGMYMVADEVTSILALKNETIADYERSFEENERALASRDATIKTQGETIAELQATVDNLRDGLRIALGIADDMRQHVPPIVSRVVAVPLGRLRHVLDNNTTSSPATPRVLEWQHGDGYVAGSGEYLIEKRLSGRFHSTVGGEDIGESATLRSAMALCERHAASVPQAEAEDRP